ncbi:clavesin-2-like [Stomoxys calcitrans]|uniref:clavesin-2-like n=1 Tax=Stomoxys calcitrans TaxID=35570 RepID=UPI0027E32E49|nr:clavesin-2-like [Stomoxys calcitrans]
MANIKPLDEELQRVAIEELGEVPKRIPEDLLALRQWLQRQPHLRYRDDDQFLIQFLRGCKYSLERAKEKLDMYYSLKTKYLDMMNLLNVHDEKFRAIGRLGFFQAMPKPLNGIGPRIGILQFNFSAHKYNIEEMFQIVTAMHELMIMQDPYACINGIIYIVDYAKATASHYLQLTPNFCKKILSFMEKSMPFRIKSVYYINTSSAAQQFFKIIVPFMSEKLQKRLHVMGDNLQEMQQDLTLQCLPKDYGGEMPSVAELALEYDKTWNDNEEFFKQNANFGTNESLRPGKPLDIDGLFGVGGTFRKLNVD